MALDLNLIITADASQAKRALSDVESGIRKVEGAARTTSDPINKVTTSVEKLAKAETNLNDIAANGLPVWFNQTRAKSDALIASDKLIAKETVLTGTLGSVTTATGLSTSALVLYAGAAGAAVIGATAVGAILASSTVHYFKHAEATRDSRDALAELAQGWESFQMMVGGAVLGQGFSIVRPVEALNVALIYTGALISARIQEARTFLNTLQSIAGALPGGNILRNMMGIGDATFSSPNTRVATTGGQVPFLPEDLDMLAGGPARFMARQLAQQRAAEQARRFYGGSLGPGWMGMPGSLPGSQVGLPQFYWPGSVGMPGMLPGTPVLPGGPGSITGFGGGFLGGGFDGYLPGTTGVMGAQYGRRPGFLSGAFGGAAGFGGGLASTILQAVTGGGSMVQGVGSYIGGGLGGMLGKSLGGMVGGIGGGALNAILPGIGSLLGPALGWLGNKMFGPTDYELRSRQLGQDRTSANAMLNTPGLRSQWDMLGGAMPFDFDFLKTQAHHDPTRVSGYLDDMVAKTDRLNEAMQRYGITWEELGDKAQQSQIDQMATTLIQDFEILTLAGADVNFVIEKMGSSVQDFIQAAIRTGSEVPAGMQPMIEKMIEMGLLTDENGEAFTSLEDTGLTFAQTMTQGFQSISDAIEHLAEALGYVPEKLDAITGSANAAADALGRVDSSSPGGDPNDPDQMHTTPDGSNNQTQYHNGGYVWPRFHRGGEVPAILQSGEFVMSRSAVNRIGAGRLSAMNSGRGGTRVSAPINIMLPDRRVLASIVADVYLDG